MRYRVLGQLELLDDATGAPVALGPKARRLLAALLLHAGEPLSLDRLADSVWAGAPPVDPRAALQVHVVRLRRHTGEDLRTVSTGYQLSPAPGDVDSTEFERLTETARRLASEGLPVDAVSTFRSALALWRGEPVDGLGGPLLDGPVRHLRRLREQAEDDHAELRLALGGGAALIAELEDRIADDPTRLRTWGQLRRALEAEGRSSAADALVATARERGVELPTLHGAHDAASVARPGPDPHAMDPLQHRLRALLAAAHPHPVPTEVLQVALRTRVEVLEAALRADPAISSGGRVTTWRLRDDIRDLMADASTPSAVDDLVGASIVVADRLSERLKGPDLAAAVGLAATVSPILEAALRDGRRAVEITATSGRWWCLQARRDLAAPVATSVLARPEHESPEWQRALHWALVLARRAGDGPLLNLLEDTLSREPPSDAVAAARWCMTRGHAVEFAVDHEASIEWFLDAAGRWEALGNGHNAAMACCNAAINAQRHGKRELAHQLLARARSQPMAILGPVPRHALVMTEAHLCFHAEDFATARDLALETEARLRGIVDRLADDGALLAAEAALLRGDPDEGRRVLARCGATAEGRNHVVSAFVQAEIELADGEPGCALRTLETLWAGESNLLRDGAGATLAGTYARLAMALDRPDLAADLLSAVPPEPGPWGRMDHELRCRLDAAAGPLPADRDMVLATIGRARDELVAAVGQM